MVRRCLAVITAAVLLSVAGTKGQRSPHEEVFATSDRCMACHNGLRTPSGEDVSIGASWRASMMANSSRDPYWQAAVRREVLDHPGAAQEIQDGCATCHMPMSRTESRLSGSHGSVFDHLPVTRESDRLDRLAHDGVACSMCHQITDQNLGTPASFTGGYVVSVPNNDRRAAAPAQGRPVFGPFRIEQGMTTIMRSATGFQPTEAPHIRQSEICGTCHTLVTKAIGPKGEVTGELPEQMPFHEWKHSAFAAEQRSCQSCHMPIVEEETPIASVLGAPRKGLARHTFVGGNFFIQRMLDRYRGDLGVIATAADLEASLKTTVDNLRRSTAEVAIERAERSGGRLAADVHVRNLTGHKLPTGYPSRRAWLHVTVRDRGGRVVFESGAVRPNGSISGNDNDTAGAVEPHYTEIHTSDQVQIYESVMADPAGRPTTGLLTGVRYLKDNRLVPRGFEKSNAYPWVAVIGTAAQDADFTDAGDRIRYVIDVNQSDGPFQIDAELRFQVIGFRWADNLRSYKAEETTRFVGYYDSMASSSSELLAAARHMVN